MTVLSCQTIRRLKLLDPCEERGVSPSGRSYGLSQCGYDLRLAELVELRPQGFILASTVERFTLPNNIVGIVHDKSSLARMGLAVQNTVAEPGWRGYLTLELTNHTHIHWITLARGEPVAQVVFHFLDEPTEQPYAGKYQDQECGPQQARVEPAIMGPNSRGPLGLD